MNTLIKKHLPILHSDDNLKTLFPTETFNVVSTEEIEILRSCLHPLLFHYP